MFCYDTKTPIQLIKNYYLTIDHLCFCYQYKSNLRMNIVHQTKWNTLTYMFAYQIN